jgi:hypothetical protein
MKYLLTYQAVVDLRDKSALVQTLALAALRQTVNGVKPLQGIPPSLGDGRVSCKQQEASPPGQSSIFTYHLGPKDIAFLEAQDRRYLATIRTANPVLFRAELKPGGDGSGLGLDLMVAHHRNLMHEFGPRTQGKAAAPVPKLGGGCSGD